MSTAPSTFKVNDVKRGVKATQAAGLPVAGVRFCKNGDFEVMIGKATTEPTGVMNEWDAVET